MADIVVYCNLNRYQITNRRDGALYDPDSKVYQALSDPTFQPCKSGVASAGSRRPFAFTNNHKDPQKVTSKGSWEGFQEWLVMSHLAYNDRFLSLYLDQAKNVSFLPSHPRLFPSSPPLYPEDDLNRFFADASKSKSFSS